MSNQPWGQAPQEPDPYQQPYSQQPPYGGQPYPSQPYGQAPYPQQTVYGQPVAYQGDPYSQSQYGQNPYGPYAARPRPAVGFGQAVRLYFKNYAVFSGRASRSEYWWVQLFVGLVWTVWGVLCLMAGGVAAVIADSDPYGSDTTTAGLGAGLIILLVIGLVMYLTLIVPNLAITWRRFHDTDKSGAFYFLALIPSVGFIIEIILLALPSVPTAWRRFDTGTLPAES